MCESVCETVCECVSVCAVKVLVSLQGPQLALALASV